MRRHGTTGERPVDRFERDEQQALLPLADRPYRRLGARPLPATSAPPAHDRGRRSAVRSGSTRRRCNEGAGGQPARPATRDAGGSQDARRPRGRRRHPGPGRQRGRDRGRGYRAAARRSDRATQQPPPPHRHARLAPAGGEDPGAVRLRLPAQYQARADREPARARLPGPPRERHFSRDRRVSERLILP